jgi:hypothetical protein
MTASSMIVRVPMLFFLVLSLALSPAQAGEMCAAAQQAAPCAGCCAAGATACCMVSDAAGSETSPVVPAPAGMGKELVFPTLLFLNASPVLIVEGPSIHKRKVARMPVPERLERICIRLI